MYQRIKKFVSLTVLLFLLTSPLAFAVDDTIIAVVNDDVITLKNLGDYLRATYVQMRAEGRSDEEIERVIADLEPRGLEKLIEDRLIVQAAKDKGMEIRPKPVDDRIDEIRKRYPSEKDFVSALTEDGLTISDLRNKITEQFMIQYIVDMEVRSKIFVNPQEVTEYYAAHKEEFKRPHRANLESIFIKFKDNVDESRKKAQEAYKKLKEGADFKEIAKTYSDSPSIGIVKKGNLLPHLDEAVFSLNTGEITPPLETETGIFIFKLLGRIPEEIPDIESVKQEITTKVFQRKFRERFHAWLNKLKKEAYVEIKE